MLTYARLFFASTLISILSLSIQNSYAQDAPKLSDNQVVFWQSLQQLCGNTYAGTVHSAPSNDTLFAGKVLLMHVRACLDDQIRIPFVVGDDLSRTWVFTKNQTALQLKHDHRHKDGTSDKITMYGGSTTNSGSATMQYFPADRQTTDILPAAGGNVWWIELIPNRSFTYNLRRMGSDRLISVRFDLTQPVAAPAAPWGWKD
ncbi:hypothetical protein [Arundinibacter roseus]|uniref:Secreted protein n=1 Tax=Arundinibacter roseus TaxID=2070510 RepID=A0A4R4KH85_9BACT|nr:hypothetical protein [Arundinibacter roseus]TDB67434.1 hypothetical protein EZE20_05670 [Arundinibacter roseus]